MGSGLGGGGGVCFCQVPLIDYGIVGAYPSSDTMFMLQNTEVFYRDPVSDAAPQLHVDRLVVGAIGQPLALDVEHGDEVVVLDVGVEA